MPSSPNEKVSISETAQALLEGRIVPATTTTWTYDPATRMEHPKTVDVEGEFVLSTPKVVKEWQEVLKDPKTRDWSNQEILNTQKRFLASVRQRDLYKDVNDEYFKEYVFKPVLDATYESPNLKKFKDDTPLATRVAFALERAIPGGAFVPSTEALALQQARMLSDISFDLSDRLTPVNITELAKAIKPEIGPKEAFNIVKDELNRQGSELPLISGRRIAEQTVPNVVRIITEFALLNKLGIPLKHTKLALKAPGTARALQTAELLGTHSAVTDIKGWKDNPAEKVNQVMKSAGLGAILGPVREYVKNPISRMGIVTGGLATQTFISAKIEGVSTDEALKGAAQTIETLLALELSGFIQHRGQLKKAYKVAKTSLVKSYQEQYPQMTVIDTVKHSEALIAGMKQEGIYKISNRLIKPLLRLEQEGKLLPEESKQLELFRERGKKLFEGTQKVISQSEKFFVDRTVSRYPGKVVDQETLEDIGSKIAKDLGINPNLITWVARRVPSWKESYQMGNVLADTQYNSYTKTWLTRISTKRPNKDVKVSILHELIHTFKPSIITKDGKIVHHHAEFKRTLAEAKKTLVTKTRKEVTKVEKMASEQFRDRRKNAEYVTKRFKSLGLSIDEQAALIYDATGKIHRGTLSLLKPEITNEHLIRIRNNIDRFKSAQNVITMQTALGVTSAEALSIKKAAGQNLDIYAKVLEGKNNVPLNKDIYIRKQQLGIIQSNARSMSKRDSGWNWFKNNEKLSFINPRNWGSSRYLFDYLSRVTGRPLLERKDFLEQSFKQGHMKWHDFGNNFLKAMNLSDSQAIKVGDSEKAVLANYLFYGKAIDFNKLSTNGKKVAGAIQGSLNEGGPVSDQVRSLMWKKLNTAYSRVEDKISKEALKKKPNKQKIGGWKKQYGRVRPSDVKMEDISHLITEGRTAKETGNFDKWIASQKWGTRQYYYMGEHEWSDFKTDTLELLKTPTLDIYEKNLKQSKVDYGALKPRKSGAKPDITANPYLKVKRHAYRAYTLNAMYDDFEKFNNSVMGVEHLLKPQDKAGIEMYRNAILGRQTDIGAANRMFMKVNEAWWDGYSKQPTRVLYFGYRNLFQNLGLLPSQISPVQFTKSALKLIKQGGPSAQAVKDYREWYDTTINQKRQMWETLSMQEHPEALNLKGMNRLLNVGREIIPLTDSINRQMLWWPLHQLATDNIDLYRKGKISSKKLMSNLRLHTVSTGHKDRMLNLLTEKNYNEFVKWYTTDKVRNAHFVYDRFGRSVLELNPTNRSYIGLATWPRGAFEAYDHNCIRPILEGVRNKNYAQAYEGVKNLAGTAVGLYIAREGMKRSFGTKGLSFGQEPYGVIGAISYNPMTPGMGWVGESFGLGLSVLNDTYDLIANTEQLRLEGKTPQQVIDRMFVKISRQTEAFIPMVDVIKEYYDKTNNKDGVRFYNVLKEWITRYDIQTDRKIKNNYQGVVDKWMTGIVGTEKERK